MALTWIAGMTAAKPLTVAAGQISGTLSAFPAYVAPGQLAGLWPYMAREDCGDLRFTLEDGTVLYYQRVSGSKAGQTGEWHVNVPSCAVGSTIWAQVGHPSLTLPSAADQQSTWGDYAGVWHYSEGSGVIAYDSTINANHAALDAPGSGTFGSGLFDGGMASGFAVSPTSASIHPATSMTLSVWFFGTDYSYWPVLASCNYDWNLNRGYTLSTGPVDANHDYLSFGINGHWAYRHTTDHFGDGNWHFATGTYDGSVVRCYLDGEEIGNAAYVGTIDYLGDHGLSHRAYYHNGNYGMAAFGGLTDEQRLRSSANSAAWVGAEYRNQYAPSSFWTAGAVVVPTTGGIPLALLQAGHARCF